MKLLRPILPILLLSLTAAASAQTGAQPAVAQSPSGAQTTPVAQQSEAQKSFDQLKTLAGTWDGAVTMPMPGADPSMPPMHVHVVLRVTSTGNAIHHEMTMEGRPDDPITMFYLDGDRLLVTHYCDAGNRPRFAARVSPDGKTFDFDFLDVSGPLNYGHMQHVAFTFIDANHHTEEWTFLMPDGKPGLAHFDLTRAK
jgi:hypothetical protein